MICRVVVDSESNLVGYHLRCPGCGWVHHFRTVPSKLNRRNGEPYPVWGFDGNLEKPTFNPSMLVIGADLDGESRCHSYLKGGIWEFLSDCTHENAGRKMPVVPYKQQQEKEETVTVKEDKAKIAELESKLIQVQDQKEISKKLHEAEKEQLVEQFKVALAKASETEDEAPAEDEEPKPPPAPPAILKYFEHGSLPSHLQEFSVPFFDLAHRFDELLPNSAEKSAGLRKLLEAKDCFVRAALDR